MGVRSSILWASPAPIRPEAPGMGMWGFTEKSHFADVGRDGKRNWCLPDLPALEWEELGRGVLGSCNNLLRCCPLRAGAGWEFQNSRAIPDHFMWC